MSLEGSHFVKRGNAEYRDPAVTKTNGKRFAIGRKLSTDCPGIYFGSNEARHSPVVISQSISFGKLDPEGSSRVASDFPSLDIDRIAPWPGTRANSMEFVKAAS